MLSTLVEERDGLLNSAGCGINSTNELLSENTFNIYPNPSNGIVYINSQINPNKNVSIYIIDLLGHEIQRFENNSFPFELNLNELPNGSYLLKFETGSSSITKKLFLSK
jgi:hypothetical protein